MTMNYNKNNNNDININNCSSNCFLKQVMIYKLHLHI